MKKPNILIVASLLISSTLAVASPAPAVFQMRLVVDDPSNDSEPMTEITHNEHNSYTNVLNVQKTVLLDQTAVKSANPGTDGLGHPIIEITLTDNGAKQFADVTRQNLHKRLAIIINGQLCQAPIIQSEISGGKAQISGQFTKQETKALAKKINNALTKE